METKTKKFDCVEMKRRGAARVREETKGLTKAEQLAYWKRGAQELLAEQAALQKEARGRGSEKGPGAEDV